MPAAAVIPAPVVYFKVVAVKKLVVEPRDGTRRRAQALYGLDPSLRRAVMACDLFCVSLHVTFYFEEIGVFQAGICH